MRSSSLVSRYLVAPGVRARAGTSVAAAVLAVAAVLPPAAAGQQSDARQGRLTVTATINGKDIRTAHSSDPLRLTTGQPARVTVQVDNGTSEQVEIRYVRLEGRVLGMSFYVFTTRVDLGLPSGVGDRRSFEVDLLDLDRQARGLIPSYVVLLSPDGKPIESTAFVADVRGSVRSVYFTFGLAVAAATVLLVAGGLWRLSSGRLPRNRWRRGVLLAAPGLGIGFTLVFTGSALRLFAPSARFWTALLLLGAVSGFVAGYLSPTPEEVDASDEEQEELGEAQEGDVRDSAAGPRESTEGRAADEESTELLTPGHPVRLRTPER
jgi:hypothetical protein